jgi:hypothetical protein
VLHRSGMVPAQVTPQSTTMLDWMFMYIKQHVRGLFDEHVDQNFSRMTVRAYVCIAHACVGAR